MKKCSKCKKQKSYDEFYKDSHTVDGYKYSCKECIKKAEKRRRQEKLAAMDANAECKNCGKPFKRNNSYSKYCSRKCYIDFKKNKKELPKEVKEFKSLYGKHPTESELNQFKSLIAYE